MKKGLALSLVVMAVGAAGFGQFATQRWYPGALGGLFVIGSGLALLQTAINRTSAFSGRSKVPRGVSP